MNYQEVIFKWKLNRVLLAEKMSMPVGTFKNKLSAKQTSYRFTEDEEKRLLKILHELGVDIKSIR